MEKKEECTTRIVAGKKSTQSCCLIPKARQWSLPGDRNRLLRELRELNVLAMAVDQRLASMVRLFRLESMGLALIVQGLTLFSLEQNRETVRTHVVFANMLRISIGVWILSLVNGLSS